MAWLSQLDVFVSVSRGLESVVYSRELFSEFVDVFANLFRVFILDDDSVHHQCYFFHLRLFHAEPGDLGDARSYSSWGFEVSYFFDVIGYEFAVEADIG